MEKHLLNILKEANTIIIPGLGALTITNDTTGEIMFMPYLKYDDGKLAGFIADAEGISTDDAKTKITQQVQTILDKLEANQPVSISGVGTFSKGADDFEFQYDNAASGETIIPTVTEPEVKIEEKVSTPEPVQEVIVEEPKVEITHEIKEEIVTPTEEATVETKEDVENIEPQKEEAPISKAEIKAKEKAEKEAKALAIKEAKDSIKAEKAAKALAEKEAKAKAKADKKNKVVPEGEEGETKPKKKRGIFFWILMVLLIGLIGGGTFVGLNFDHYKEMIPFLHHEESGHEENHEEKTEEHSEGTTEHSTGKKDHSSNTEEHSSTNQTATPSHSKPTAQSGSFYIILGTFGEKVNAEGLAERVVMDGVSSASVIERNGSYSVVYNKYSTKDAAKAELEQARVNFPKAWVYTAE